MKLKQDFIFHLPFIKNFSVVWKLIKNSYVHYRRTLTFVPIVMKT